MDDFRMTFREATELFFSERVSDTACGGVVGCPSWYGLEKNPPLNCDHSEEGCTKCWNRLVPRD